MEESRQTLGPPLSKRQVTVAQVIESYMEGWLHIRPREVIKQVVGWCFSTL